MTIVAFDFDKTLTMDGGDPYWVDPFDERPNERMVELANECYHRGYTVIVYTARRESVRRETQMWLDTWNVKYHSLVMEKLGYDVLVDDRVLHATVVEADGMDAIEGILE